MQIHSSIRNVFVQLSSTLEQLTPAEYSQPSKLLNNASIGQHVRHIIELFIQLEKGYDHGVINYEKRKRDIRIETDKEYAAELMHNIYTHLDRPAKTLLLEAAYDDSSDETFTVETNYHREIVYNLEHTVHHMALIRVGVNDVSKLQLPEGFGVASSTIKYRKACAQ